MPVRITNRAAANRSRWKSPVIGLASIGVHVGRIYQLQAFSCISRRVPNPDLGCVGGWFRPVCQCNNNWIDCRMNWKSCRWRRSSFSDLWEPGRGATPLRNCQPNRLTINNCEGRKRATRRRGTSVKLCDSLGCNFIPRKHRQACPHLYTRRCHRGVRMEFRRL